ncbi:MAG: Arc family DNA-binding protein [Marinicellaceae bacterium]
MSKKKSFPLRINEDVLKAAQQWAADDLRSVNAQLEYIIREALWKSGRLKKAEPKQISEK